MLVEAHLPTVPLHHNTNIVIEPQYQFQSLTESNCTILDILSSDRSSGVVKICLGNHGEKIGMKKWK
jgi:hypothetical protein